MHWLLSLMLRPLTGGASVFLHWYSVWPASIVHGRSVWFCMAIIRLPFGWNISCSILCFQLVSIIHCVACLLIWLVLFLCFVYRIHIHICMHKLLCILLFSNLYVYVSTYVCMYAHYTCIAYVHGWNTLCTYHVYSVCMYICICDRAWDDWPCEHKYTMLYFH